MRTLLHNNQAFGAACVFESHLSTHPVIRLNAEALVLAIQIYAELNRIEHAVDIVDFVEECEVEAPEVFNALLRAYIRRGEVEEAEQFVLRMKHSQCEITPDLYFKLAQLFASNGREDAIKEIHQEALMWFPEDASRIQAVLIRYYLANDRIQEAQSVMRDMYVSGATFHGSIFSALLEMRLRHNVPNAIVQTLEEMGTLGVTPNSEFSVSVIKALLSKDSPDTALSFVQALSRDNYMRTPLYYHLIMKYYLDQGDHWSNIRVYRFLRADKMAPLTRFSFMRLIPSFAAISLKLNTSHESEEKETIREILSAKLLELLDDLIFSQVDPEPMSVGYLIDLLARQHPDQALRLAKHSFQQLRTGVWKRSVGAINTTAYGLYHYGTLEDQCEFADYVIESQIIPPAYIIAIILRQMKLETEAAAPEIPQTCRFNLPAFVTLLEQHAFHLELPTYIVDRFATALIERGLTVEASQMFAAAMQSLKPVDHRNFNAYKEVASWHTSTKRNKDKSKKKSDVGQTSSSSASSSSNLTETADKFNADVELRSNNETIRTDTRPQPTESELAKDLDFDRLRQFSSEKIQELPDLDQTEMFSTQFEARPQDYVVAEEEEETPTKTSEKMDSIKLSKFENSL